jgi:hypothetical protein
LLRKAIVQSIHMLVMRAHRQKQDDWDWHSQHPQQNPTPKAHDNLLIPVLVHSRRESDGGLLDSNEAKCVPRGQASCRPSKHEDAFGDTQVYLLAQAFPGAAGGHAASVAGF